jgi:hypothetical protein
MTRLDSLLGEDWRATIDKLGGTASLAASAFETKAFQRARAIPDAVTLLRLVLAYCLGEHGLRLTAAWAAASGLADISNVGLLQRLKRCDAWLERLVGDMLAARAPGAARGRLIRVVDATTVPKASPAERRRNGIWRVHSAFDLPSERFGYFEVTDQAGGERLDRIPVVKGEIRVADAAYIQPERIAAVLAEGGDVVVRAAWRNGRWLNEAGETFDFTAAFAATRDGLIDLPIQLCRKGNTPLQLRVIARRLAPEAVEAARRKARHAANQSGYTISAEALGAAEWVMLVTSLRAPAFPAEDVLALYRLRWRVELAFKRLKSVIGLKGPPGKDPSTAKVFILAHLLMILLLEPLVDAFEDSPHWAAAA